jgi:hypothetical protein
MRPLLTFLGLAAGAFAQNAPPRPVIQGTVVEFETNRGLPGAHVLLTGDGIDVRVPPQQTSDSQGNFRFELEKFGHYSVTVQMAGYKAMGNSFPDMPAITGPMPVSMVNNVVLTSGYPSENLRFSLVRTAELTGRVVDEETGKPVAKLQVAAVSRQYLKGQAVVGLGVRAVTDDDGQFVFTGILPGNYLVETLPRRLDSRGVQTEFSVEDLKIVDQDYERSYWPGGTDAQRASPIPVSSGASVNVGTLKPGKAPYYRIHATFPPGSCRAGETAQVLFAHVPPQGIESQTGQVGCGQDFLIKNVQPGSYRLTAYSGRTLETRVQGSEPVEVTDRNLDVTVSLGRGLDLDGRIIVADGAGQPPLDKIAIFVQPLDFVLNSGPPVHADQQGAFHVVNAALGRQVISLINLGNFYIKEVRYSGLTAADGHFVVDGSPGRLEVVLDDKPGAVAGIVEDGGNALSRPYVVLTSWPISSDGMFSSLKNVTGDENGKFRFGGLTPGDYRVVAVPSGSKERLDEPGVLDRLLSGAESVTVGPGVSQDLRLRVVDALR